MGGSINYHRKVLLCQSFYQNRFVLENMFAAVVLSTACRGFLGAGSPYRVGASSLAGDKHCPNEPNTSPRQQSFQPSCLRMLGNVTPCSVISGW